MTRLAPALLLLALVAGCPAGTGTNRTPDQVLSGASAGPGAVPVTGAATGEPRTGATATPAAGATPGPTPTAAVEGCERATPAKYDTGTPRHGRFANTRLPKGWVQNYDTEFKILGAIDKYAGEPDWPCFQQFYPDAYAVWKAARGK